jgi:hypothetical protein
MTRLTTAMFAALLAGGMIALPAFAESKPAKKAGVLHVYGNADTKLFSDDGIKRAESAMHSTQFEGGMMMTVDTYPEIPADKKAGYKEENKARFFNEWAKQRAGDDKAKGVYVLICRSPGYVEVIASNTTRDRGFSSEDKNVVRDTFINAFKDATKAKKDGKPDAEIVKIRDDALVSAVSFVANDLQDTHAPSVASTKSDQDKTARSVGGWICLGLCILLGVWLVIGIIRALTAPPGGYGGGGYGGGGGGFGSSLLGGLFGAMAGMWLYNSMFGGHHDMGGSDAYAGDGGGDMGGGDDGDFSGDSGSGGSYDDGGGDWGGDTGGGGDFGGGGDWGGGGDFGGDF